MEVFLTVFVVVCILFALYVAHLQDKHKERVNELHRRNDKLTLENQRLNAEKIDSIEKRQRKGGDLLMDTPVSTHGVIGAMKGLHEVIDNLANMPLQLSHEDLVDKLVTERINLMFKFDFLVDRLIAHGATFSQLSKFE